MPAQGDVARTITQPATIQGIEEATLYARAAGYLKSLSVDKGDRVRAGQVLAVIESPELRHQEDQARAEYAQSKASALGAVASRVRAHEDVAQAAAGIERARADARQAEAVVARTRADQARAEAQAPKLRAMEQEAEAGSLQAAQQLEQAKADVERWQQQLKEAQSSQRAMEAAVQKAQADARLQKLTFARLKAVQEKDSGLIAGQQVDEARARSDASQSEVEAARGRLDAAKQQVGVVEQQLASARRGVAAAEQKLEAAKAHARAAHEELGITRQEVAAAREQVKVAQAQAEAARKQVEVAQGQRRSLGAQVDVANAQVSAAREQAAGKRSALGTAASMADYTQIVAPFDGIVTERYVDPGALVQNSSAGQAGRGIVKVVRDRSLRVLLPVPEVDLPRVRKGQPASIVADAYPKTPFSGRVTRFAGAVDPKSRTLLTEIDLPSEGGRLRPGMYARVTLTLETHRGALSVPTEAVMGKDEDRFVYTVREGKARKTPVTVGVDDGKTAEITSGLTSKSQVVLVGRDTLVDGAAVKAEPAKLEPAKR